MALQPQPQPKQVSRPYRRFLTSALHQRFVHASSLALLVCWSTAFCLGKKDSYFWSWFPISLTGFRAVLLFGSCLAVFILRVASLQFSRRTTSSPFESLRISIFNTTTTQIAFWYLSSAWWFSEVYIWFSSPSENLGWIVKGDLGTPDRLNERPLYLRSVFIMLAVAQTLLHLYNDYSCVHLPVSAPTKNPTLDNRTHKLLPLKVRLQKALPVILQRCALTSGTFAFLGPFIYALFLRQTMWSWQVSFAKLIHNLPRSDARPSGYPPSRPSFMLQSFLVGFMLMLTWETTSLVFSTFLAQEPLKKDQPLSASSKDPNGTLITGLKARRDVVKTFAFWELAIISQKHPDRRKSIFADIEREEGPAWAQMQVSALEVVQGIKTRIDAVVSGRDKESEQPRNVDAMEIDSLPCIAPPIQVKPIYTQPPPPQTRSEEWESYIERRAQQIGQSKSPFRPLIPDTQGLIKYIGPVGSPPLDSASPPSLIKYAWSRMQSSPLGWFLRTNFERRVNTIVVGAPYANAAVTVDAIEATTRMLVASLSEDIYGRAIHGVPSTVRTFTSTIQAIETLAQNTKEEATEDSDIEEVEVILARLKAGLSEILSGFQIYLVDQGLSAAEHRQAQNASIPGRLLPELHERRKEKEGEGKAKQPPPPPPESRMRDQQHRNGNVRRNASSNGHHRGTEQQQNAGTKTVSGAEARTGIAAATKRERGDGGGGRETTDHQPQRRLEPPPQPQQDEDAATAPTAWAKRKPLFENNKAGQGREREREMKMVRS